MMKLLSGCGSSPVKLEHIIEDKYERDKNLRILVVVILGSLAALTLDSDSEMESEPISLVEKNFREILVLFVNRFLNADTFLNLCAGNLFQWPTHNKILVCDFLHGHILLPGLQNVMNRTIFL